MDFKFVKYEVRKQVGILTLNRPDVLNSITREMQTEIRAVLQQIADTRDCRVLVITGAGRGFSAGADLSKIDMTPDDGLMERIDPGKLLSEAYNPTVRMLQGLRVPTIAAVNGVAAGAGASLALQCDIIVADTKASFIQSFNKIGMIPDAGATWTLVNKIGYARAMGLCMTGKRLDAATAKQWGLVWDVSDNCLDDAITLAGQLAQMPSDALVTLRQIMSLACQQDLESQLEVETQHQSRLGKSPDFVEAVNAFMEKRPAVFKE
ncbi:enoyl-CoA hydratase-related protein [Sphingobium sp. JS3065]|uniref:enoyl-CoA hydratase-related protein n=1 Tax=Sphingobium sp. JS3065 TaxID=2970925 RepID=UPI0022652B45|nr:enoyl-CoA hydratase-related protein [Sphingobium sp. JS3065]UZW56415.1 enoyl-CoA hydratase-related protein [Sphingobium sp. JS3065]